jgi:hypothetical protein
MLYECQGHYINIEMICDMEYIPEENKTVIYFNNHCIKLDGNYISNIKAHVRKVINSRVYKLNYSGGN